MAQDDYHVIVFRILEYLYKCLKEGKKVDAAMLEYDSDLIRASNEDYWRFIICNIQESGYIKGIVFLEQGGASYPMPSKLSRCTITPEGIEYFFDNKFLQKVRRVIRDLPISI